MNDLGMSCMTIENFNGFLLENRGTGWEISSNWGYTFRLVNTNFKFKFITATPAQLICQVQGHVHGQNDPNRVNYLNFFLNDVEHGDDYGYGRFRISGSYGGWYPLNLVKFWDLKVPGYYEVELRSASTNTF